MFTQILKKILGTQNEREIKKIKTNFLERVNSYEEELDKMKNKELRELALSYLEKVKKGETTTDDIICEYFAVVREVSKRVLGLRHFDVQIIGGVVLYEGKIAEMRTGEGKTLVASLPLSLRSLERGCCHLVTVNDYLARRDAMWMGPIYKFLGLSVGVINQLETSYKVEWVSPSSVEKAIEENIRVWPEGHLINDPLPREILNSSAIGIFQTHLIETSRKDAYQCDITYGTNNEFAFDYLRDNMKFSLDEMVQKELYYAIIDEVDSILIDEARTPLIISGPAEESTELYYRVNSIIPALKNNEDFTLDEKTKSAIFTEKGVLKSERLLGVSNLYDPVNIEILHHLIQGIRAHHIFKRDVDYIVKDGKAVIVDEFTGRLMPGRRWSDGLHQAVEAKEGLKIESENQTLASISFQNFFRMYKKLAGMTGTAETEAVEFKKIYNLDVIVIPTHKPMIREDLDDVVFLSEEDKFSAVLKEIEELYKEGRPVLVGTTSIEKNEKLSKLLQRRGIPHQVLNAKNHEREAFIIAQAGRLKSVTIATNMAGRGVDIVLGGNSEMLAKQEVGYDANPEEYETSLKKYENICREERKKVIELGGLHIIGTERHEARRVDNQLRGRSGRQGDPGSSRFYLSLQDDLMRIFGSDRMAPLMQKFGMKKGEPIEHRWVTKAIENAQRRVEAYNFELRKHLLDYDDVMNKQRTTIYSLRRAILSSDDLKGYVIDFIEDIISSLFESYIPEKGEVDIESFLLEFENIFGYKPDCEKEIGLEKEKVIEDAKRKYEEKEKMLESEEQEQGEARGDGSNGKNKVLRKIEKYFLLSTLDHLWREHLLAMDHLREAVGLRGYGQKDPLVEYKREGFEVFNNMLQRFKEGVVKRLFMIKPEKESADEEKKRLWLERFEIGRAGQRRHLSDRSVSGKRRGLQKLSQRQSQTHGQIQIQVQRQGQQIQHKSLGRNDPCPCGSGKKYKKCCGKN